MKLTKTLLSYLNRVYNKDPQAFVALALDYQGTGLTWTVADGVLTTAVTGGAGSNLTVDLSMYTIASLVSFIAAQPSYVVTFVADPNVSTLSALTLIDATGDISTQGGGNLLAYASTLWAYLEANAAELQLAEDQIAILPGEMSTSTADTIWLDLLGKYYDVPRYVNESDVLYGPRIIATVLRPASNNVAIEMAIETYTGQLATVVDVVLPGVTGNVYNGQHLHDGSIFYDAKSTPVYGLFDVTYSYDVQKGGDLTTFQATVIALVNALRAAGTHMRSIALSGTTLQDSPPMPTESFAITSGADFEEAAFLPLEALSVIPISIATFSDQVPGVPSDSGTASIVYNYQYNGIRLHNGVATYNSGQTATVPF